MLTVCLTWKNKAGKRVGTSRKMLITLIKDFSFDRVEEAGEPLPLDNPTNYREFWHKVWQGTFSKEFKSLTFDCKYYYLLDDQRTVNARMETLTRLEESGLKKKTGKLKSGMSLSPNALNQLIPRLSAHPVPGEEELAALQTPDFQDRFQQATRTQVRFAGRDGESVALWVYPVVKLQRVILRKITVTNENGHVTEMAEHAVHFPIPVMAHFVGLSTEE